MCILILLAISGTLLGLLAWLAGNYPERRKR